MLFRSVGFNFNNSQELRVDDTSRDFDLDITNNSYAPRINLMIGFNYVIKDNFILGAEILPHFTYSYTVTKKYNAAINETITTDRKGYSYGFNSNSAQLTFLYRF